MKRTLSIYLMTMFLISAAWHVQAQEKRTAPGRTNSAPVIYDVKRLESLIQNYYRDPQPDELMNVLLVISKNKDLVFDPSHFLPFSHFVSAVADNAPGFMNRLKREEKTASGLQKMVLKRIVAEAEAFKSPEPLTPRDIDFLWSEFFATGKEAPVLKIIEVLKKEKTGFYDSLFIGSAEWSLTSNARTHERVYEILLKEASTSERPASQRIFVILKAASSDKKE